MRRNGATISPQGGGRGYPAALPRETFVPAPAPPFRTAKCISPHENLDVISSRRYLNKFSAGSAIIKHTTTISAGGFIVNTVMLELPIDALASPGVSTESLTKWLWRVSASPALNRYKALTGLRACG